MDQRLMFIAEYLKQDETVADLCRAFGISRKTGYKFIKRYEEQGLDGLKEPPRGPHRPANAMADETIATLVKIRSAHPRWGPRKILAFLARTDPKMKLPAASTVGDLYRRLGLVKGRRRRRTVALYSSPFIACTAPNHVWSADFKGWFEVGDGTRCDPLTLTDGYSRYLLRCQSVPATDFERAQPVLESAFREFGLPEAIRSDNGPPLASGAICGLSQLSIWWIRLGIRPERIMPGRPTQNGRHERMHWTLKQETAQPPRATIAEQQATFDSFRREFNEVRPHEAIGNRTPAELYTSSIRAFPETLPEPVYPEGYRVFRVREWGQVRWPANGKTFSFGHVLGGPIAPPRIVARHVP